MRPRLAAAALALTAVVPNAVRPAAVRAQVAPGDTGTSAAPVPPWERRVPARFGVGGAALYQSGRAVEPAGAGFDAFGSVAVSAFSLGVGYQRSAHRVSGSAGGAATYQGLFVEPRLALVSFRGFTPYVAGRVGFLAHEVPARSNASGAPAAASSDRVTTLGAGVGALVPVAPGVHLDLTGMYAGVQGGAAPAGVAALGALRRAVTLRAGITLGFGRWGR